MEGDHLCRYCNQTYSRYNEPLLIVCLCDGRVKYAHGSCFRSWTKFHEFGVCDACLTKTKIVKDGRKSFGETSCPAATPKIVFSIILAILWFAGLLGVLLWMIIKQCWQSYCIVIASILAAFLLITLLTCVISKDIRRFWRTLSVNGHYWKVVYCREEDMGKKIVRRYSDVPLSIPKEYMRKSIYNDEVTEKHDDSELYNYEFAVNDFSGAVESKPSAWAPTNYPYVKKNPLYINKEVPRSKRGYSDVTDYAPRKTEQPSSSHHSFNSHATQSSNEFYFAEPSTRGSNIRSSQQSNSSKLSKDHNGNFNMGHSNNAYRHSVVKHDDQVITRSRHGSTNSNSSRVSVHQHSGVKQISLNYIDQRADSFYKNSSQNFDAEKYRRLTNLRRQSHRGRHNDGKHRENEQVKRASSEPDVRKKDSVYQRFGYLFKSTSNTQLQSPHVTGKFRFKTQSSTDITSSSVMPAQSDIVFKTSSYLLSNERKLSRQNPKSQSAYTSSSTENLNGFPIQQRARSMYLPKDVDGDTSSLYDNALSFSRQNSIERTPEPTPREWKSDPNILRSTKKERSTRDSDRQKRAGSSEVSRKYEINRHDSRQPATSRKNSDQPIPVKRSSKTKHRGSTENIQIAVEPNHPIPKKRSSKNKHAKQGSSDSTHVLVRDNSSIVQPITNSTNNANAISVTKSDKYGSKERKERRRSSDKKKYLVKTQQQQQQQQQGEEQNKKVDQKEIERIMQTPLHKLDMTELFKDTQTYGKKRPSLFPQDPDRPNKSLFFEP